MGNNAPELILKRGRTTYDNIDITALSLVIHVAFRPSNPPSILSIVSVS